MGSVVLFLFYGSIVFFVIAAVTRVYRSVNAPLHVHFKPLGDEGPLAPLPDPQFIVYDKNTHRLPSLKVISLNDTHCA